MLLPIPVLADFELIRQRRQTIIDKNLQEENKKRNLTKDYRAGDSVLVKVHNPHSLQERATGPYIVTQVHTNGTVTIQRMPNVFERINIRRIRPYNRRA